MQDRIEDSLARAVKSLHENGILPSADVKIEVRSTPDDVAGDYSTNLALAQSSLSGIKVTKLAQLIIDELPKEPWLIKADFAPPGFINFHCQLATENKIIAKVLQEKEKFGSITDSKGKEIVKQKILVEYVSVNPTGPLHTGHGRAAAVGSTLVNILRFVGHDVDGEFYVNDGGRQMQILTATFLLRLMQLQGEPLEDIPQGMYQGEYIMGIARLWQESQGEKKLPSLPAVADILHIEQDEKEQEVRIDKIITLLESRLGSDFSKAADFILTNMMQTIRDDLNKFGVHHDSWYYESSTIKDKEDIKMIEVLQKNNYVYEKNGAIWFNSKKFGDDKDRVLKRSNGNMTYFANDIAYHNNKYERGYDRIVDILGADHHGYINRIRSSMQALGRDADSFDVLLIQLAFLVKRGVRVSMSTRADTFESLASLMEKVGVDAARFFYLMYRRDRQMDFDIDLATSKSKDNPVYYVQYAHARICRLFDELDKNKEHNWAEIRTKGLEMLELLVDKREQSLAMKLSRFPNVLFEINNKYETHLLPLYLRELASEFHSYYNAVRILGKGDEMAPRLCLCAAVKITIANGLHLMGVNAPDKM